MSRCLDLPTVPAVGTGVGKNTAVRNRGGARVLHITPQHHLAPIAVVRGARINHAVGAHAHRGGLAQGAAALPIAANQHRATR